MRKNDHIRMLPYSALFGLLGLLIGTMAPAIETEVSASEVQIRVETEPNSPEFGWVYVTGVDRDVLARLRESRPDLHRWRRMFSVQLRAPSPKLERDELPNVAGRYEVLESGLRFIPRFTPTRGLAYHVVVRLGDQEPMTGVAVLNDALSPFHTKAKVDAIYPSARGIPENTLRLYVHFSRPMRRGQVASKIRLLDENNDVIQNAFIIGPLGELWDRDQRRLTLLLDPGRIKRGVGPNRKLGPALEAGGRRTLSIDGQFTDAKGHPIEAEVRKTYEIGDAIRDAVSPREWIVTAPASGSRAPLRLRFARALDSGMLSHAIRVHDVDGARVEGHAGLSASETQWSFTPTRPWSNRVYAIRVATNLEDISGNNILAPLDVVITSAPAAPAKKPIGRHAEIQFTPITPSN